MNNYSLPEALSSAFHVRKLAYADLDDIFGLCCKNEIFYRFHPPVVTFESILEDMQALPPGKTYADKYYIGFFREDRLVAVMDLILDYPKAGIAFIGFFMMNMDFQGRGIGTLIIHQSLARLATLGYRSVQLGIDKGNPQSEAFWTKCGFVKTGRELPNEISAYVYMEHAL